MKKIIGIILSIIMIACVVVEMSADAAKKYNIVGILKGDINLDGKIDAIDASMVLSEYAAISSGKDSTLTTTQRYQADMNNDRSVDAVDASRILAVYAYNATHDDQFTITTVWFAAEYRDVNGVVQLTPDPCTYEECEAAIAQYESENPTTGNYQYSITRVTFAYGEYVDGVHWTIYRRTNSSVVKDRLIY